MRYSLEKKCRKYVHGYGFLSFARKFESNYGKKCVNTTTKTGNNSEKKFGDKYGKKIMDTVKKSGIDAAKVASSRVVQKTAGATGDLIGIKIADKIISLGEPKSDEKEEIKEPEEIYIPPGKRQLIIDDLRLF